MIFADKVFRNAKIYTVNAEQPWAEAVAVTGDMIVAVGSDAELEMLIGPETKVMDLKGKFLLPGFNDCHCHLLQYGISLMNVNLTPESAPDIESMKAQIAQRAAEVGPGKWILGWGYNETLMKERRQPNLYDLTEAAPDNPVFITRTCVHMSVANKMALEMAGIDNNTPDPPDGIIDRDEEGNITGLLKEGAQNPVKQCIPRTGKNDLVKAIGLGSRACLQNGITSVWDAGTLLEIDGELEAWIEATVGGALTVRCVSSMTEEVADRAMEVGLASGYGGKMHKFGPVKLFMDGNIAGKTAGVTEPFLLPPYGLGVLYMEPEVIAAKIKKYHDAGYQIAVHAIGDRTVDVVMNGFEAALEANPRDDHRHRIEHLTLASRHFERLKQVGVNITLQPGFIYFLGADFPPNVGRERANRTMATRSAIQAKLHWGISTDCTVIDNHPKYTLYAALTRNIISGGDCGSEEQIDIAEALEAYTKSGAYLSFDEDIKGMIKPGMLADFAVLSINPFEMKKPEELLQMEILHTILGGEVVYSQEN